MEPNETRAAPRLTPSISQISLINLHNGALAVQARKAAPARLSNVTRDAPGDRFL